MNGGIRFSVVGSEIHIILDLERARELHACSYMDVEPSFYPFLAVEHRNLMSAIMEVEKQLDMKLHGPEE